MFETTLVGTRDENEAIIRLFIAALSIANQSRIAEGKKPLAHRIEADRIRAGILGNDAQVLHVYLESVI